MRKKRFPFSNFGYDAKQIRSLTFAANIYKLFHQLQKRKSINSLLSHFGTRKRDDKYNVVARDVGCSA
jgi:hypothetical protein